MPNINGKTVEYLFTIIGQACVRLSTILHSKLAIIPPYSAQPALLPSFIPTFTQDISPPKFAFLPLVEYIFYPVSTAPINNPTKEKIKERY
jgi:hypothetical protein